MHNQQAHTQHPQCAQCCAQYREDSTKHLDDMTETNSCKVSAESTRWEVWEDGEEEGCKEQLIG